MTYLRIKDVSKSYDGTAMAVNRISIDIEKGEFVSFLGPSGSGKTTTLVMVAGFEDLTSGEFLLNGRDLTRLKPWDRNIGMVFQNYALFPHMTVRRNIEFPLRMRNAESSHVTARVNEMLELVGLGSFADRYPRELSGGQQQRVALARGLVFNPDVLLLDEPLGALDKNLREQMQGEIKRIHREVGITMIYVTHDQTEAMSMSDRIAVFNEGRLEQVGGPLEVYHTPRTRFVGEFVGDSNFFNARRSPNGPGELIVDGLGVIRVAPEKLEAVGSSDAVYVMVRPESIRMLEEPASGASNAFDMTVSTIVNYGDSLLVTGMANGVSLRMRVPGQRRSIEEKSTMRVGWALDAAHLIPRS